MDHGKSLEHLRGSTIVGRMHRRTVLKRAAAIAMGSSALSALLAACGSSTAAPTATTGAAPLPLRAPAASGGTTANATTIAPRIGSAVAPATVAAGSSAAAPSGQGVRGGTLNVALIGEPPTLDIHQTTASITFYVGWTMFESLFTWDANYQIIPSLAESLNISTDQLTQTIKLRKGVKFHNGQEMKGADCSRLLPALGGQERRRQEYHGRDGYGDHAGRLHP